MARYLLVSQDQCKMQTKALRQKDDGLSDASSKDCETVRSLLVQYMSDVFLGDEPRSVGECNRRIQIPDAR